MLASVPSTQYSLNLAVGNGQMQMTWPADHIGWRLETQTNPLNTGLGTNWVTVLDLDMTNQVFIPISVTNGSVFSGSFIREGTD